jgi:cytochrome c556
MKPALLTASILALIGVAACNARSGNETAAAPESSTGNAVATPAGPITAAQAYDIRHERYEDMGDSFKAINRELKGDAPDVARIQREAATLATLAEQIPSWFPAGSGPDVHAKSRAKAEIWSDPEGFRRAHGNYLQQIQAFRRVADSGDVAQIRAAAQPLGKSCGNCHDSYRGPER